VEGAEGQPSHHRVEIVHESLVKAHLWEEKGRTSDLPWAGTAFQEYELRRGR
jgi:hypothetical protein